jgi:polyhydroxyalkanoate synthesis regulator phasin
MITDSDGIRMLNAIRGLTSALELHTTQINSLTARIERLENKIEDLEGS